MTRLINADELTAQIMCVAMDKCIVYGNDALKRGKEIFALAMVAQAPTVDAEPVTRCKDCKAYNGMKCVRNNMIAVRVNDYCSRAERKEE